MMSARSISARKAVRFLGLVVAAILLSTGTVAAKPLVGVNIYGLSHHFLHRGESRESLSEVNPGLGVRIVFGGRKSNWFVVEGGAFSDTYDNAAKYFVTGPALRVLAEGRLGFFAGVYSSESIRPVTILALVPSASYRIGACTLNFILLPKYKDVNPWYILGAYLTIGLS